ncbi:hypothetical protein NHX12_019025, partial [Muraenolepis orangiensis]
MPAGMFSIDSILAARPSCKDSLLLQRSGGPVLFSGLSDSLYTAEYGGLYSPSGAPGGPAPSLQAVSGTRMGYNHYYYGQQGLPGGPACCTGGALPGLGSPQCPCIPTERGLGAAGPGASSDDVLHERGHPLQDRAPAAQPAALPQEAPPPDHLHGRAAGGPGEPLPGDQVPGRGHPGAAGPEGAPQGGEGG